MIIICCHCEDLGVYDMPPGGCLRECGICVFMCVFVIRSLYSRLGPEAGISWGEPVGEIGEM